MKLEELEAYLSQPLRRISDTAAALVLQHTHRCNTCGLFIDAQTVGHGGLGGVCPGRPVPLATPKLQAFVYDAPFSPHRYRAATKAERLDLINRGG